MRKILGILFLFLVVILLSAHPVSAAAPRQNNGDYSVYLPLTIAGFPRPEDCDRALFVSDVTIPDGTVMPEGKTFWKTWRIENFGTCTWTADYAVIFVDGDLLGGPIAQPLLGPVPPGSRVDISVPFTAPTVPGSYKSNWMLRNELGGSFGLGADNLPFWVQITVK